MLASQTLILEIDLYHINFPHDPLQLQCLGKCDADRTLTADGSQSTGC